MASRDPLKAKNYFQFSEIAIIYTAMQQKEKNWQVEYERHATP